MTAVSALETVDADGLDAEVLGADGLDAEALAAGGVDVEVVGLDDDASAAAQRCRAARTGSSG